MEKEYYSLEELTDEFVGKRGESQREEFEKDVEAAMIGSTLKKVRRAKNLTQKELGNRMGIQSAQVSKIESGKNLTISTITRVLNALGLRAELVINDPSGEQFRIGI